MQANTTAGLIGANAYLQETRVPMKVFKEARAEGDTAKMERAMGYVEKLGSSAIEYKKQADKGLKEEAKQARDDIKEKQEELAQRIKERRTETEERIEEAREHEGVESAAAESGDSTAAVETTAETDFAGAANLTYTGTGEVKEQSAEAEFSVVV